jgi:hypothetical protein
MVEAPYRIRTATQADSDQIRKTIKVTLANPEGRAVRKSYRDAAQRGELLVLERYDSRERTWQVAAFVEWHTRIDGSMTIRDAGSVGEEPQTGIIKRLMREMLRLQAPSAATVKVRADQALWNGVFEELPGFQLEGKEYTRPHWRNIWTWTRQAERARPATARERGQPKPRR